MVSLPLNFLIQYLFIHREYTRENFPILRQLKFCSVHTDESKNSICNFDGQAQILNETMFFVHQRSPIWTRTESLGVDDLFYSISFPASEKHNSEIKLVVCIQSTSRSVVASVGKCASCIHHHMKGSASESVVKVAFIN